MKLDIKYYPPYNGGRSRCFELNRIINQKQEVYPYFAEMFNGCDIAKYPDFLSSILNFKAGERWHDWYGVGFVKGPVEFPETHEEQGYSVKEEEVFTYNEDGISIVPLAHFYEVVLLHAAEVLRIVKAEDILSYWKKEEPHRYRETWESEMNRLMGLIRQAWEMEKSK
jgi:hypothetical protein